jgi:hypothetical protein
MAIDLSALPRILGFCFKRPVHRQRGCQHTKPQKEPQPNEELQRHRGYGRGISVKQTGAERHPNVPASQRCYSKKEAEPSANYKASNEDVSDQS